MRNVLSSVFAARCLINPEGRHARRMLEQLPVELIKNLFSPSTGKAFGNRTQNWDSVLILLEFCATYPFPANCCQ
jgi:hypothetical protein